MSAKMKQASSHRKQRCSFPVAFVVSLATFPPVMVVATIMIAGAALGGGELGTDGQHVAIFLLGFVVAGCASWSVYNSLRWRKIVTDTRVCIMCGYDLTGNVSGICPECGGPARTEQSHD